MSLHWQISVGQLFEWLRPTVFALAALLSTWVFADARRRGFALYAGLAWALAALFLPLIAFPLFLVARMAKRAPHIEPTTIAQNVAQQADGDNSSEGQETDVAPVAPLSLPAAKNVSTFRARRHRRLTLSYAAILFSSGALYFYLDYHSLDAHLARASDAKLHNQRTRAIYEYRAALHLKDDPHVHKLLGVELADTHQWEPSLAEFRAAERGGEPDDTLPFRIAVALDALNHADEATVEYQKFWRSDLCKGAAADSRCERAKARAHGAP